MKKLQVVTIAAVLMSTGCYHAVVDTGRPPSGQTIKKEWAHGFIAGLVPPSAVETAAQCPNGVAKVETQLSFLNQLANALTFGIYTPMTIEVQCAAASGGGENEQVLLQAPATDAREFLTSAALKSLERGMAVYVDLN